MEGIGLVADLGLTLGVAFMLGLVAYYLRLPLLVGYLIGGIAIGPYALGLIYDIHSVQVLSEVGVALLMFTLGIEFSLADLSRIRKVAVGGGLLQIVATVGFTTGIFWLLGFGGRASLAMGFIVSISSTMIVMRTLMERGESQSLHGRIALSILIVQDLAVVAMLALLPVLANRGPSTVQEMVGTALKAGAYLGIALILAQSLIPRLMRRVAKTANRELFVVGVVSVVVGSALATTAIGFSLALGAFVAGLILSESEYNHEVLASVIPLREIFSILFFASVGMLIDPRILAQSWGLILGLVALVILLKCGVTFISIIAFGQHPRTAFLVAASMGQIGEFSFLMDRAARESGLLSQEVYSSILVAALVTILITPFLMRSSSRLYQRIVALPGLRKWREAAHPVLSAPIDEGSPSLHNHVIICGWSRAGREVGDVFRRRNVPFIAVDFDQSALEPLRREGVPCIYGDASNPIVLESAHPESARLAIITMGDPFSARQALRTLRRLNPELNIVVSVHSLPEIETMYEAGASEIIYPQLEVALEIIRYALLKLGVPVEEVQPYVDGIRLNRYPVAARTESPAAAQVLEDHYVICGGGRMGGRISDELIRAGMKLVVIEMDPDRAYDLGNRGVTVLWGDAANPRMLQRAGIAKARALVAATPSNAGNLYITVTARRMKPDLFIVACTTLPEEEDKFRESGADRVISPYTVGSTHVSSLLLRPITAQLLEEATSGVRADFQFEEITVTPESPLCGRTLEEADIRHATGANVVAVQHDGQILANPAVDYRLQAGQTLICVGTAEQIAALRTRAAVNK
ncbi:MAG: sodium:calcium exchanger [Armatimonadetes bacterium]|nr:sodium:calcium exchanger [Armatimonadota bacterium]